MSKAHKGKPLDAASTNRWMRLMLTKLRWYSGNELWIMNIVANVVIYFFIPISFLLIATEIILMLQRK
jgi:hypothetical protein